MSTALATFNAPISHEDVGVNLCADYLIKSIGLEAASRLILIAGVGSPDCRSVGDFDRLTHRVWCDCREAYRTTAAPRD